MANHSRSEKIALILIGAGVILLAVTLTYAEYYYHGPVHQIPARTSRDVNSIQDWMTIRYIARTYQVPEQILSNSIQIDPTQATHQSLRAIAKLEHKDPQQIIANLRATIQMYKGAN